jgi:hypothetical protein
MQAGPSSEAGGTGGVVSHSLRGRPQTLADGSPLPPVRTREVQTQTEPHRDLDRRGSGRVLHARLVPKVHPVDGTCVTPATGSVSRRDSFGGRRLGSARARWPRRTGSTRPGLRGNSRLLNPERTELARSAERDGRTRKSRTYALPARGWENRGKRSHRSVADGAPIVFRMYASSKMSSSRRTLRSVNSSSAYHFEPNRTRVRRMGTTSAPFSVSSHRT